MKQDEHAQKEIEALLIRVREGEEDAFSLLCDRFSPMLSSLLSQFSGGSAYEAEQAQEARIALYRAALTYASADGAVTFGLYARVCVRNALVSFLRAHHKNADAYSLDELGAGFWRDEKSPLDTLITAEAVADIYRRAKTVLFRSSVSLLSLAKVRRKEKSQSLSTQLTTLRNTSTKSAIKANIKRATICS